MTRTHELDHDREHDDLRRSADAALAPGRSTRTQDLVGPTGQMPTGILMRKGKAIDDTAAAHPEAVVAEASTSTGAPLPSDLQSKFEGSLGADLSSVRIHTGPASTAATEAVGARAYAQGQDIHFNASEYDPSSAGGEELLAHEVAHTVQQQGNGGGRQFKLAVSSSGDALEQEADSAAAAMVRGQPATVGSHGAAGIARKEKEPANKEPPKKGADGAHKLDDKERAIVQSGQSRISAAQASFASAKSSLDAYASAAPGLIAQFKKASNTTIKMYEDAQRQVNIAIQGAKDTEAFRDAMLDAMLDTAFMVPGVGEALDAAKNAVRLALKVGKSGAKAYKECYDSASDLIGPVAEAAAKDAETGDGGAGDGSTTRNLAFFAQLSDLHAQSTQLLPLAMSLATIAQPLQKLEDKIAEILASGEMTVSSPQQVNTAAENAAYGSSQLASAASSADSALTQLHEAVDRANATIPADKMTVEKDLWIKWLGSLPTHDDSPDIDGIEKRLDKLGIFEKLGINRGDYFDDDESDLTICTAEALDRVLAHRGEVVNLESPLSLAGGIVWTYGKGYKDGLSEGPGKITNAWISKPDLSVKDMKGFGRKAFVDHILASGWIAVEVTRIESVMDGSGS